jgi:hypothetical protein
MGKSVPVVVGSLAFETKALAKEFFRALRDRYADGVQIGVEDGSYLGELLTGHPEAEQKIGAGIAFFSVATEAEFHRTRHFMVHRTDGTASDFSFLSCIDGRSPKRDRQEALRRAIDDQIVAFRERCFVEQPAPICPLRGIPITRSAYHVDHVPPGKFLVIADAWLREFGLAWTDVEITPPGDNQIVARMTNDNQRAAWSTFHRRHARLRLLSPLANLSDANRTPRSRVAINVL